MSKLRPCASLLFLVLATFGGWPASWCVGQESAPSPATCACRRSTVFILDGAGDFFGTTDNFSTAVRRRGHPIDVVTFEWSHGKLRMVADQTDHCWLMTQGKRFAKIVQEHHQHHPETPIHIVAHSAGAHVALVALENLPPGIVKQVVFMAPSVSVHYDVRPALRAVDVRLTNYYSERDWIYLGVITRVLGTTDRLRAASAGHKSFRQAFTPDEADLAAKLVQRPWRVRDLLHGNDGGHYGAYHVWFLNTEVIPRLLAGF